MGWVVSPPPLPPLPPSTNTYPFYRRLGGQRGRSGRAKILVRTGIRSPDRPSRAQSLYRLSYPAHQYGSKRCKLQLLVPQCCLLNTKFWQIHYLSTNSSISSHLLLFALLQFALSLLCQEGALLALFQSSCYLGCSVVIFAVL